ncbi:MAG: TetR/AcrR family transcriptional regulator [Anaerolineae bacterium]|nr:TetR/AcrR family transcriptional regulator [Anaerolineae bacterium]
MKNTKTDRRSERTRAQLRTALVDLMSEKLYADISVQDILDRANVGRSTFYGHFESKDDLLATSLQWLIQWLHHSTLESTNARNPLLPSLEFFRHVKQHQRLYKALIWGRGIDYVSKNLQAQLSQVVERNLLALAPMTAPEKMAAVTNFVAGAFLNMLTWWMDGHSAYSAEQIDELFCELVQAGVQGSLHVNFSASSAHPPS